MRKHRDVTAEGFAARLRMTAQRRGHTSARNKSGVDVGGVLPPVAPWRYPW